MSKDKSSWSKTIGRFLQKSVLGALLSNICLNYLFFHAKKNLKCAGDVKEVNKTKHAVKKSPGNGFRIIENWFHKNIIVLNAK